MDPEWGWLQLQPEQGKWALPTNSYPDGSTADLSHLRSLLAQVPFAFPTEFVTFLERPSLHARIRSSTACILELSVFPVFTASPPNGVIIQFLVDQQGVLRWYLWTDSSSDQAVLVSGEAFGSGHSSRTQVGDMIDLFRGDFWLCARSFREFIYRFWFENEVWFSLREGHQLSPRQESYLSHFRQARPE
jgi:hypothetical protein